jgi:Na+/melibiose symporter-like transporter
MPLFLEVLLQNQFPEYFCPLIMGISFLLPHLNNFYFLQLCAKKGTYSVIQMLLIIKLVIASIVYMADYTMIWIIAIFIASNRIFTEGICKLCDLIISDLIDEDYIKHHRQSTASQFVFGASALMTKPGQTFAPLIGTLLLSKMANHNFKEVVDFETHEMVPTLEELSKLKQPYLFVLTTVPMFCATLQLILWKKFDLHGNKLNLIKSSINKVHLV